MSDVLFIVFIWCVLITFFLRAYVTGRITTYSGWAQYALCLLAFTLSGVQPEQTIDGFFGGFPVTLMLKNVIFFLWFYLFMDFLRRVGFESRWYGLSRIVFIGGFLLTFIGWLMYTQISPAERLMARDVLIGLRDALLLVPVLIVFVPGSYYVLRKEQVREMRVRVGIVLFGYSVLYPVIALSNIVAGFNTLVPVVNFTAVRESLPFVLYTGAVSLLFMLVPMRKIDREYPRKLNIYYKLRQLERQVYMAGGRPYIDGELTLITGLKKIDMLIYQTVINILDFRMFLTPDEHSLDLYVQLMRVARAKNDYNTLVEKLTGLCP